MCGGLGHKSRTCDQITARQGISSEDLSECLSESDYRRSAWNDYDDDFADDSAVRAATLLMKFSAGTKQPIDLSMLAPPRLPLAPAPADYAPMPPRSVPMPFYHPYAQQHLIFT